VPIFNRPLYFVNNLRNFGKNLLTLVFGCLVALVVLEVGLRLFSPFEMRVKGNRIVLQTNVEWRYAAPDGSRLDANILHRKNNIGFRGEDFDPSRDALRVFAVGGSTTECIFLSEGKTWVDLLGRRLSDHFPSLWLNNAGFDGHSTYGHRILVADHIARYQPDLLIFMLGVNDVGLTGLKISERSMLKTLVRHSETANLILALRSAARAKRRGIWHNTSGLSEDWLVSWKIEQETIAASVSYARTHEREYRDRVTELVRQARSMGARVALVTQPVLYGGGIDEPTGLDLGLIHVNGVDGKTAWGMLEGYNAMTRAVAQEQGVLLIDLARLLPKNSTYFYDTIHFTNEGAEEVGMAVYRALCPYVADLFPDRVIQSCPDQSLGPD
jgi:lysophospholipase L1-like esterase